ncbi:MAG TPA: hypothetical protein VKS01_11170, partial [Bryobacteraceae bacterium]|nr:hypothetical protein [Bryobacteraceae bacterium]
MNGASVQSADNSAAASATGDDAKASTNASQSEASPPSFEDVLSEFDAESKDGQQNKKKDPDASSAPVVASAVATPAREILPVVLA